MNTLLNDISTHHRIRTHGKLKTYTLLIMVIGLLVSNTLYAGANDDPLLSKLMLDQFEFRDGDDANPFVLEGQLWLGYDLNKLWIKTEYESLQGETEAAEIQALYSKAISAYWDFQAGVRRDLEWDALPGRNWAVIGFQGLSPYFFEVDTALFIGESGRNALRLEAEYELLFTQKLILTPEIEVNFYTQNDAETGSGSGLSNAEIGFRLRYEIRREFAPYIGINWEKKFGNTADFSKLNGDSTRETQIVVGIRIWF